MAHNPVVFRKHLSVGNPSAEEDDEFLRNCFIDSGDLGVITDLENSKCIVLGRTGSGKSALLRHIADSEEHVIRIAPESLAMRFICHSTIIAYFESVGVKLDIFYQFLWRHVFCIELIRARYKIVDKSAAQGFMQSMADKISPNPGKQAALKYLREWEDTFWMDTEHSIKQLVNKFEATVDSGISIEGLPLSAKIGASGVLSKEESIDVSNRGQSIVNSIQMQDLANVISFLDQASDDAYDSYYFVIDNLDENWVDDPTRYKLLRALIEAIKTFRRIKWQKIVIALRTDLLERVFEHTRDSGFQAEKYEALFLRLSWTREQLKTLIDSRVEYLFKKQYSGELVKFVDIFPNKVQGVLTFDYMLERTLLRPRDIISFINDCLEKAQGKTTILGRMLSAVEGTYSQKRFDALRDEWSVDHPLLREYCSVRRKKSPSFRLNDIEDSEASELALSLATNERAASDVLAEKAAKYVDGILTKRAFLSEWACCLYKIGILGIKPDATVSVQWSYIGAPTIPATSISDQAIFHVHPMVIRALGVSDSGEYRET